MSEAYYQHPWDYPPGAVPGVAVERPQVLPRPVPHPPCQPPEDSDLWERYEESYEIYLDALDSYNKWSGMEKLYASPAT